MSTTRKFVFSLFALMLVLAAARTGAAQEEPAFQPVILYDGAPVAGQLEDVYTAILYGFNASQGDVVRISMNPLNSAVDTYLVLLGEHSELLTFDDDSGDDEGESGAQFSALIRDFELPYDGSYYVLATSYDFIDGMFGTFDPLAAPLSFEIMVSGITPPDHLDDFDPPVTHVSALAAERGVEHTLELTQEWPVAFITFDGAAGDVVSLGSRSEKPQPTPILHLFAPDGRRLAMSQVLDGDSRTANLDGIKLPQNGRYLFMTMDVFFMDRVEYPDNPTYGLGTLYVTVQ